MSNPRVSRVLTVFGPWEVSTIPGSTVAFGPGDRYQVEFGDVEHSAAVHYMRERADWIKWPEFSHVADLNADPVVRGSDRCQLCDAHISEPHDPTCAVGALAEIADAWAEMGTDDTSALRRIGEVLIRAEAVGL